MIPIKLRLFGITFLGEKLEYLSREEERKRWILQVTGRIITLIQTIMTSNTMHKHFVHHHEDASKWNWCKPFCTEKTSRNHTLLLTFTDMRDKKCIFLNRKRLRESSNEAQNQLYINDHLTSYNYSIMMSVKCKNTGYYLLSVSDIYWQYCEQKDLTSLIYWYQ